jgi:menaquinone-dependent protoporphyrinogen oxidase
MKDMNVLVAYASKYGATRGIAERLADRLQAAGLEAQAQPVTSVRDLSEYGAFVIGSGAYLGHWLKDATAFVRGNSDALASRPTWLFSSGPLGPETTDGEGRELRLAAEPKEFAELNQTIKPTGTRVFFGALDPGRLGFRDRAVRTLPAGRALLPEGDFRDWPDIDAWAAGIAVQLSTAPAD